MKLTTATATAAMILMVTLANAGEPAISTLAWTVPTHLTDGDLITNSVGSIVWWGEATSPTNSVDVGVANTVMLTNLTWGTAYYAKVVAYLPDGSMSDPSQTLAWTPEQERKPYPMPTGEPAVSGHEIMLVHVLVIEDGELVEKWIDSRLIPTGGE